MESEQPISYFERREFRQLTAGLEAEVAPQPPTDGWNPEVRPDPFDITPDRALPVGHIAFQGDFPTES